jgi:hypothetical protein
MGGGVVMGCGKATRGISKPLGPVSSDIIIMQTSQLNVKAARTMADIQWI